MILSLKDSPIRRKLIIMLMLIGVVVMVMMRLAFFTYEYLTFRDAMFRQISILGKVIADNSTAALAFGSPDDANETLSALRAEPNIVAASLYDQSGKLFAQYPAPLPESRFPTAPGADGFRFASSRLIGFEPVVQRGKRLGTLYLEQNAGGVLAAWLRGSLGIALAVMSLATLLAYLLARVLQQEISRPILALADAAKAVSDRQDYSVRVHKFGQDELGALTDAFNRMLAELERITRDLEQRVRDRTAQLAATHGELEREQARLKFIFDTMPVGLSFTVAQSDGTVTRLLNDTHLRICGLSRDLAPTQADFDRISHPEDYERQQVLVRDLDAGKIASFTLDKRYRHADGQVVWVILSTQRRRLDDGVCEDLSVVIDITERKRAEEALHLANQKLETQTTRLAAANAELEAFSYSVSHDLRAPLRHVDGFANLLAKRSTAVLDAQSLRYVSTISNAAKQMGRLIDDLLGFSRMNRTTLSLAEVDQNALVATIIQEGRFDQNGSTIIWDIAPLPAVKADAPMLRQVWANLIENAVKYSGKNPRPAVAIGCQSAGDGAAEHVFFVRDNGVGFDMAYAAKLFGVFQRLHSPTEFEGTGIGLANVRRIVLRHGGRTWAEGRVGEGAMFYFSLPFTPPSL